MAHDDDYNNDFGWKSDQLLAPGGMAMYTDQIRQIFRDHRGDFRDLANDLQGDLKHNPPAGDNGLQANYHAWKTARILHQMAGHAQAIITLAAKLRATHQDIYVELPKRREAKAEAKALEKASQGAQVARTAGNVNDLVRQMAAHTAGQADGDQAGQPTATPAQVGHLPVFDMFKTGTGQ
ncbi:hypothetical protein ACFXDE_28590 [Kitasatospora sp. NPDC059408]|uniref:hypothetical protein n=1 Tax=Kitasatospora sp. NPDC059408 TaxID=3346823 RepID=UPI00368ADA66